MKGVIFALLIMMLLFIGLASSHLDGGSDVSVNGYLIDFGYTPDKPMANERTIILFNLLNASTNESIYPDRVWIRISENDTILFSGQFSPVAGSTTFTYTFSKPGDYSIDATFYNNQTVLVQKTLNLAVGGTQPASSTAKPPFYLYVVIGILLILLLYSLSHRKIRKDKK